MENQENSFARLSAVNVAPHLDKKGPYSYLSWPFVVSELRKLEPTATWEVMRWEGLPYLQTEVGFFVEVAVTVSGITLSQLLPVLDGKNRPILAPTCFDINTSIQRCLVKAIALHGLGLSVFAGEDLQLTEQPEASSQPARQTPARRSTQVKQVGSGLTNEQQAEVKKLVNDSGADMQRLLDYFNVSTLADIRATQYERVIRSLQHKRAA